MRKSIPSNGPAYLIWIRYPWFFRILPWCVVTFEDCFVSSDDFCMISPYPQSLYLRLAGIIIVIALKLQPSWGIFMEWIFIIFTRLQCCKKILIVFFYSLLISSFNAGKVINLIEIESSISSHSSETRLPFTHLHIRNPPWSHFSVELISKPDKKCG